MRHRNGYRMSRRHTTIASVLSGLLLVAAAGCGSGHHQANPQTTTTAATTTTTQLPTTSTPSTRPGGTTTTTVLGPSGPSSSYPAAQPTPPSLKGAYPTGATVNLVTVLKTLTTYEDWVWSHPNPKLVANYELQSSNTYASEVKNITQFEQMGLHAAPLPAEIDFVKVVTQPRPQMLASGKPVMVGTYQLFLGGEVTAVYNLKPISMVTANGSPSGQQFNPTALGPTGYGISLVQGPDGQFRFADVRELNPAGGVAALEAGQ